MATPRQTSFLPPDAGGEPPGDPGEDQRPAAGPEAVQAAANPAEGAQPDPAVEPRGHEDPWAAVANPEPQAAPRPGFRDVSAPDDDLLPDDDPWGDATESPAELESKLLAPLNEPQRQAVLRDTGPLLILAGAGSGKTRAVTTRIVRLLCVRGLEPWRLCAITFTNKAAREMRTRVAQQVDTQGLWIGTFHAICARILRREIDQLPPFTRDFSIYDTGDRNRLIKQLVKDGGWDPQRFRPGLLAAEISRWKNEAVRFTDGPVVSQSDGGIDDEVFATVRDRYDEAMRAQNALDFDDLLLKVVELFEREPGVRDKYARQFLHVMVDEYQDTNRVQYLLLRHLALTHGNVCVCGDPDQSIYAWRGADVRNILDFERDFPGAVEVRLEQNYRSTKNILQAAQGLIANNQQRKEKDLWSEGEPGALVQVLECGTEDDEALEIAQQIRAQQARGRSLDDIAVFYRVNFMQRALEQALARMQIPHEVVSGTAFYERREVKDLLCWLRLLINQRDDEAFRRAISAPSRGVGAKSLAVVEQWAADRRCSLLEAARSTELVAQIRGRARNGLTTFAAVFEGLEHLKDDPASGALARILDETNYLDWLRSQEGDDVDREENVREFCARAETFDRDRPDGGLRGFLEDVALVSDQDGIEEGQGRVSLMTLHTAKGLEFGAVFVAGCEEGLLPHSRSIGDGYEDENEAGIEEERRLLYVGMTRAEEELMLTCAQRRRHFGQETFSNPSRFLREIPSEFLVGGHGEDEDEESVLGRYEQQEDVPKLKVGDRVHHDHFGVGRVERLVGQGRNARATVVFDFAGTKQLLLSYAKLEVVG